MRFDIVIVGAGLSAGPVIEHLVAVSNGAQVALIDRGVEGAATGERSIQFVRNGAVRTAPHWWTSSLPGGAANLWYGQLSRFEDIDFFSLPEDRNETVEPWATGQLGFAPHYDQVERLLRPYCADHLLKGRQVPGRASLVTPRQTLSTFERVTYDVLRAEGWQPYCGSTCLGGHGWSSAPVDPVSLEELTLETPTGHARNWAHRNRSAVARTPRFTLFPGQQVRSITPVSDGYRVTSIGRTGRTIDYLANRVILAGGVTSTIPLLATLPAVDKTLLGRRFTLTTELTAYIGTDIPRESFIDRKIGRFANISSRHLYAPNGVDAHMGGKISIYDARSFEGEARHAAKLSGLRRANKSIGDLPSDRVTLKLSFKGTSEPSRQKFIETDKSGQPVLNYAPTVKDEALIEFVEQQVRALAEVFPGGKLLGLSDNVRGDDISSAHLHGGAVFGSAPRKSVLDPNCEVRGAPGIFVVDASFMPGSGGTNSSHTVLANALRVARLLDVGLQS